MRMMRGEPALDGEEQAGEQRKAAQRGNGADRSAEHRQRNCHQGEHERARENRARLAKERGRRG